ncbi:MHYT domain-containing protein [Nocardia fluminea]|uniref:NO-binding membrane sensor protein with MHYT domain n=1 Tax=Nocardia fluminea TaxID=134984 RepID=A0A2N3VGS2_9NOCA|nr:MHYT domain-containing protein [Nocardia fluminea]PKV80803.1 NO-binding membrane sensor protein with MHYT domain [Nocardia fluminea]
MLDIYHFSYGWITPVLAYFMSVTGCLLGLQCAARGRNATEGRVGWLIGAAIAIGGTGIWVMHFIAMLGFTIHGAEIRYDIPLTLFSAITAMVVVGIGLFMVNKPQPTLRSLLSGGIITGLGVGTMHYTGMYAMRSSATVCYDPALVALSIVIAVVASVVALWFTLRVKSFLATVGAALIMGVAVCGMHYTGMAAMHAHIGHQAAPGTGAEAMQLLAPLIGVSSIVTMLVLISVSLTEIENEEALPRMWLTSRHRPRPRPAEPARPVAQYAPNPQHEYRTEELSYDGAGAWPRRVVD